MKIISHTRIRRAGALVAMFYAILHPSAHAADWVALQEADKPDVFFTVQSYPMSANLLKIGQVIRANRDINVRAKPADWTGVQRVLKKGQSVAIYELKSLPIPGREPQIWARVSATISAANLAVPPDNAASEKLDPKAESAAFNKQPSFAAADVVKACGALRTKLQKPKLRGEQTKIGHYTDIFTPPQTKTECTNVKDLGVPDPSSCTTVYDDCGERIDYYVGWTCKPTTSTRCTNMKACDTWKTWKKTMECDVTFQLKLPDFIDKPVSEFIDKNFEVIESAQAELSAALPIECASDAIKSEAKPKPGESLAQSVTEMVKRKIEERVRHEAEEWLKETAVTTIAASIPSGGVGGGAALATSVGKFVYRVHSAVKPIMSVANDVKSFAEDVGFGTSCGWSDWSEVKL